MWTVTIEEKSIMVIQECITWIDLEMIRPLPLFYCIEADLKTKKADHS